MPEREGLQRSLDNYIKGAQTIGAVAEAVTNVQTPEKTIEQWGVLLSAIRIVDDRFDNLGTVEKRQQFFSDLNISLAGDSSIITHDVPLCNAVDSIRALSESLPETKRAIFINSLRGVLKITEKIKTETDPQKLSFLTRLEGQLTSRPFIMLLPEEYKNNPNYTKLIKVIIRLGRLGNSLDSFYDLPTDYNKGETQTVPTPRNRIKLLTGAIADARYVLQNVRPSRKLAGQLKWVFVDLAQSNSEKPSLTPGQN